MMLFVLVWLALLAAAAGLAVGALRGRPLPGGPCAVRAVMGPSACEGCPVHAPAAEAEAAAEAGPDAPPRDEEDAR